MLVVLITLLNIFCLARYSIFWRVTLKNVIFTALYKETFTGLTWPPTFTRRLNLAWNVPTQTKTIFMQFSIAISIHKYSRTRLTAYSGKLFLVIISGRHTKFPREIITTKITSTQAESTFSTTELSVTVSLTLFLLDNRQHLLINF